ncbi:MAG TPA: flagellar hook-associated protein FlgL [Chloroflexota bacterium]|nr:flagellar hook-associated protein FlgL [Chloroflexota bacterium]
MIGMRVTDQMQLDTVLNAFQANEQSLERAQQIVTTDKNVSQPSDDPYAASQAILFRQRIGLNTQLQSNLNEAKGWLDASDSALNSLDDVLQRARQLAIQMSNDTYTTADRQNASNEIHQLLLQAVDIGNSRFGGQYLFGGTKTTIQPFQHDGSAQSPNISGGARPPVTYNGDTGSVTRQADQAAQLKINVSGDEFQSAMNDLAQLEWDMNNSLHRVSGSISGIDPSTGTMTGRLDASNKAITVNTFSINGVAIGHAITLSPQSSVLANRTIPGVAAGDTVQVTGFQSGDSIQTVVNDINNVSNQTGVTASIDRNGVLVLQNSPTNTSQIVVSSVDQVITGQDLTTGKTVDLTGGTGTPVPTGGSTANDLGLSDTIDNAIGSADVVALDSSLSTVQKLRAQIGAKSNRVDEAATRLTSLGITLTQLDSSIEDADMAKAVSNLASRQTAFQAALAVAAKTLPPTLLDFLR